MKISISGDGTLVLLPQALTVVTVKKCLKKHQEVAVRTIAQKQIRYCDRKYPNWRSRINEYIDPCSNTHSLIAQVAGEYLTGLCDSDDESLFQEIFDPELSVAEFQYLAYLLNRYSKTRFAQTA